MTKKEFTGAFDSVMNDGEQLDTSTTQTTGKKRVGRPSSPENYGRTSLILNKEQVAKVKVIAQTEGFTMKDIVEKALGDIIDRYEKRHGEVVVESLTKEKSIDDIF